MHTQLRAIIDMIEGGTPLSEAEQTVLTFDHTDLGAYVARTSNFPERIIAAVEFHHDPEGFAGENGQLLEIVEIANCLATEHGVTALGVATAPEISGRACRAVGFTEDKRDALAEKIDETLQAAGVLAGI